MDRIEKLDRVDVWTIYYLLESFGDLGARSIN